MRAMAMPFRAGKEMWKSRSHMMTMMRHIGMSVGEETSAAYLNRHQVQILPFRDPELTPPTPAHQARGLVYCSLKRVQLSQ